MKPPSQVFKILGYIIFANTVFPHVVFALEKFRSLNSFILSSKKMKCWLKLYEEMRYTSLMVYTITNQGVTLKNLNYFTFCSIFGDFSLNFFLLL